MLAAFRRASAGRVLIDGADPYENAGLTEQICFVRDRLDAVDSDRVAGVLAWPGRFGRTGTRSTPST